MIYDVQSKIYEINTIVLDLNGTLSVEGKLPKGVKKKIKQLKNLGFKILLFTGNQRGNAQELCSKIGIDFVVTKSSKEKEREMLKLDVKKCAAIGNARIDIGTFKHAKISILTLQAEGIHTGVIKYADIIVPSIVDALELFINKDSLCGTLKE